MIYVASDTSGQIAFKSHLRFLRAYVLRGGASSRIGRNKALVRFCTTPLLLEIVQWR
jgi:hypothetical protein